MKQKKQIYVKKIEKLDDPLKRSQEKVTLGEMEKLQPGKATAQESSWHRDGGTASLQSVQYNDKQLLT